MVRITANEAGGENVRAFLQMLKHSEGTAGSGDDGYNMLVGGHFFDGYAGHPRIAVPTRYGFSSAAGAYQIMAAVPGKVKTDTWDWAHKAAGVKDFSPLSQDRVAIYLITRAGALEAVKAGNLAYALGACAKTWASLPGAGYGQREQAMASLRAWYLEADGRLRERH